MCPMRLFPSFAIAGIAVLAACSSSGTEIVTPPPPPVQHLYVGDDAATGSLRSYTLPLTAASTPVVAIAMNKPFLMGINSTTFALTLLGGNIQLFALPLTSASTPFATIATTSNTTPVFTAAGLLYQGSSTGINVFTPPFTNASAPSSSIITAGFSPFNMAIDPNGNTYVTSGGNTIGVVTGTTLTTTLTAAAGVNFRGLAATATQLFACEFTGASNNIFIYSLPLTPAALPAVTINIGANGSEACALDSSGNLYAGAIGGNILVFAPPFTNASVPTVTLTTPAVIFGMAVGP